MGKPHELSVDVGNMNSTSVTTAGVVPVPSSSESKFVSETLHLKLEIYYYYYIYYIYILYYYYILLKNTNEPLGRREVNTVNTTKYHR
jgi:hypothetical protein